MCNLKDAELSHYSNLTSMTACRMNTHTMFVPCFTETGNRAQHIWLGVKMFIRMRRAKFCARLA